MHSKRPQVSSYSVQLIIEVISSNAIYFLSIYRRRSETKKCEYAICGRGTSSHTGEFVFHSYPSPLPFSPLYAVSETISCDWNRLILVPRIRDADNILTYGKWLPWVPTVVLSTRVFFSPAPPYGIYVRVAYYIRCVIVCEYNRQTQK